MFDCRLDGLTNRTYSHNPSASVPATCSIEPLEPCNAATGDLSNDMVRGMLRYSRKGRRNERESISKTSGTFEDNRRRGIGPHQQIRLQRLATRFGLGEEFSGLHLAPRGSGDPRKRFARGFQDWSHPVEKYQDRWTLTTRRTFNRLSAFRSFAGVRQVSVPGSWPLIQEKGVTRSPVTGRPNLGLKC